MSSRTVWVVATGNGYLGRKAADVKFKHARIFTRRQDADAAVTPAVRHWKVVEATVSL